MNKEEIKMNRQILNEISQLKKKMGDRYSSPNQSNSKLHKNDPDM
jgi:hypothetical protein